jgi:hypothetical protein
MWASQNESHLSSVCLEPLLFLPEHSGFFIKNLNIT